LRRFTACAHLLGVDGQACQVYSEQRLHQPHGLDLGDVAVNARHAATRRNVYACVACATACARVGQEGAGVRVGRARADTGVRCGCAAERCPTGAPREGTAGCTAPVGGSKTCSLSRGITHHATAASESRQCTHALASSGPQACPSTARPRLHDGNTRCDCRSAPVGGGDGLATAVPTHSTTIARQHAHSPRRPQQC
jgi:hypothetical protein